MMDDVMVDSESDKEIPVTTAPATRAKKIVLWEGRKKRYTVPDGRSYGFVGLTIGLDGWSRYALNIEKN